MSAPQDKLDQASTKLDYARPVNRDVFSAATREAARRVAQRAAALAGVLFLGGIVAGNTIPQLNGSYGDESFVLLLFLLSLLSLLVWVVAFCIANMPPMWRA